MGWDPRALAAALGAPVPDARLAGGRRAGGARAHAAGDQAEDEVIAANRLYREEGIAQVDKIPTPVVRHRDRPEGLKPGRFVASYEARDPRDGAPVDFVGQARVGGAVRPVRIEVKSSSEPRIDVARLEPHQVRDLELAQRLGAVAGVLLRYTAEEAGRPVRRWRWYPMPAWLAAVEGAAAAGRKSLNRGDIEGAGVACPSMRLGPWPDWRRAMELAEAADDPQADALEADPDRWRHVAEGLPEERVAAGKVRLRNVVEVGRFRPGFAPEIGAGHVEGRVWFTNLGDAPTHWRPLRLPEGMRL